MRPYDISLDLEVRMTIRPSPTKSIWPILVPNLKKTVSIQEHLANISPKIEQNQFPTKNICKLVYSLLLAGTWKSQKIKFGAFFIWPGRISSLFRRHKIGKARHWVMLHSCGFSMLLWGLQKGESRVKFLSQCNIYATVSFSLSRNVFIDEPNECLLGADAPIQAICC